MITKAQESQNMTTETLSSSSISLRDRTHYGKLTLLQLAERIVDGDTKALKHLHDHRLMRHKRWKHPVPLAKYIAGLKDSKMARTWSGHDDLVLDEAYNLTIDKVCNIPASVENAGEPSRRDVDCRHYFKAFIVCAKEQLEAKPPTNAIEAEIAVTETLLRLIRRHFLLSCWEAKRRRQKLRRRYMWMVNGKKLYLWLPLELPSHRCREWLTENIPDVDPHRPGEKYRVQAVVDRLLAKKKIFYFSDLNKIDEELPPSPHSIPWIIRDEISTQGLAEAVATEKVENIKEQRPAIRLLGQDKLKELIRTVFISIAYADYVEKDIARRFGLSCATFSRFAGAHWEKCRDDRVAVVPPDLWKNTAEVLSGHPDFIIAAEKAGVWKQVSQMSQNKSKTRRI